MTTKTFCDACTKETKNFRRVEFTGHSFIDEKTPLSMPYWCGDMCFSCQYKMRRALGISNKEIDLR